MTFDGFWVNISFLISISFSQSYVALKIQKSAPQFAQAALHEIEILSAIAEGDPSNSKLVIRLVDQFKHAGPNGQHLCMVLKFLGDSLLQLIKYNRYKGLALNKVREICKCILTGLDYLHRELGLIHTDLKPKNIQFGLSWHVEFNHILYILRTLSPPVVFSILQTTTLI